MEWIPYDSLPNKQRMDFGCVKINDHQIILVAGKRNLSGLKRCDLFDLETRRWSRGPSLPIEMSFCRATLVGEYVYVCGLYKEFYRLNVENLSIGWQRLPAMKVDGLGCELVSDSRYVYRIGDNYKRTTFHRYDTKYNTWETLRSLSEGRDMLGVTIVDGEIYAIGGRSGLSGDTILNSVEIYDPSTNTWRSGPELPRSLFGHSVHAIGTFIFVSGGQRSYSSKPLASMLVLDTFSQEWSPLDIHLPFGTTGHSMISSGWNLFLIGGKSNSNNYMIHEDMIMIKIDPDLHRPKQSSMDLSYHKKSHMRMGRRASISNMFSKAFSTVQIIVKD